jgi:hypothetical protein
MRLDGKREWASNEKWEGGGDDWHGEEGWRMRLWRCESCCCMIRRSQEIGGGSSG